MAKAFMRNLGIATAIVTWFAIFIVGLLWALTQSLEHSNHWGLMVPYLIAVLGLALIATVPFTSIVPETKGD